MSQVRERVYATEQEATVNLREHEQVFYCTYEQRTGFVCARTHPFARAAFGLYIGITCTTDLPKRPLTPEQIVATLTPEQREQMLTLLGK